MDSPHPADPDWLEAVDSTFGEYQLVPMTINGEGGLVCQMQVEEDILPHLRRFSSDKSYAIQKALGPLLEEPPAPKLRLCEDEDTHLWLSDLPV